VCTWAQTASRSFTSRSGQWATCRFLLAAMHTPPPELFLSLRKMVKSTGNSSLDKIWQSNLVSWQRTISGCSLCSNSYYYYFRIIIIRLCSRLTALWRYINFVFFRPSGWFSRGDYIHRNHLEATVVLGLMLSLSVRSTGTKWYTGITVQRSEWNASRDWWRVSKKRGSKRWHATCWADPYRRWLLHAFVHMVWQTAAGIVNP